MLVAHESPLSLLEDVREQTDYDYALVHLFEEYDEYYKFFEQSLAMGREVILDNSIFELGTAFDSKKYVEYIKKLKPTYFIVPDVLEDCGQTMSTFNKFMLNHGHELPEQCLKIGVVQGKTYQDLADCYEYMAYNNDVDYIAISFDYSWYQDDVYIPITRSLKNQKILKQCIGREQLIRRFIKDGIWNYNKPHHLLGCSLAREFRNYKDIPNVRSCDTSNPVMSAIKGHRYIKDIGLLDFKPEGLLADHLDVDVDSDTKELVSYNITQFKNIINS